MKKVFLAIFLVTSLIAYSSELFVSVNDKEDFKITSYSRDSYMDKNKNYERLFTTYISAYYKNDLRILDLVEAYAEDKIIEKLNIKVKENGDIIKEITSKNVKVISYNENNSEYDSLFSFSMEDKETEIKYYKYGKIEKTIYFKVNEIKNTQKKEDDKK